MSQLTIYLDAKALKDVQTAARREKLSVSRWACLRLTQAAHRAWPKDYFELFGALKGAALERPPQGAPERDVRRKSL